MPVATAGLQVKSLDRPEETRHFEKGRVDLAHVGESVVGRATFQPGWKWSECVKPLAGTDLCQQTHIGYVISGRMAILMADGTLKEVGPGDAMYCPPGHDAWVIGNEPVVTLDFAGMATYAKPGS